MRLIGKNEDGARYHLWPIRFGWHDNTIPRLKFFAWHGWQTGYDTVPHEKTSRGCMPGYRSTFGQTLHIGRLFICFGPRSWQGKRAAR